MRENDKEEKVKHEIDEIKTINIELEHSVAKLLSENECLHKEIKHLKNIYKDQFDSIKKTRALSNEHCESLIAQLNSKSMENADLKGQIQEKIFVTTTLQSELRRLKGKHVLDNATTITNATSIAPGMFKLDIEPLSHRLKNNRDAHEDNLKKTIKNIDTIRGLLERARKQNPSKPLLDSACKFTKHVQELLVYVSQRCPIFTKPSDKLVAVTPINKVNKVRFLKPLTSLSNIHKQVESSKTSDSNTPVLSSTILNCSTSTCRSQPTGNKKNGRISQKPSSDNKNKVEAQPRKVNKKNCVKEPICDVNVKHTMLNANSQLICVKCKQCMFNANHDACFLDFVNDVNVRSKSKSAKKSQQHNIWKPTGKVFTEVGLKWKRTGRLFTIIGNPCPLTRITPTKVVHLKETTPNSVKTPKLEIKVYSKRPKPVKLVGSSKKTKTVESKIANNSKPTHLWGSSATDVPSSYSLVNDRLSKLFSGTVRFRNDQVAKIMGYVDYQLGNVIMSRVYYVEGLGHNLFSVGKFCDADLEVAFRKNTCFIQNLEGVDLLSGSRDTNLYTISLDDMLKTSPICLLSKASKTKSWLWHLRLSHLNFDTLNKLAKDGHARGILKLKFQQDYLCSACALGKAIAAAPRAVDIADSYVSTSIDQDAPLTSIPLTKEQEHSPIISQGSSSNVRLSHTPLELIGIWTKDHTIANVIRDPSCSVSTRKQLKTDSMWCYFDAFLTAVEPKNFKQEMIEPSRINAMQEEIHEFERLQV
ncbi:retrovirus-related pol polyprotein from transposon TNT 1-94 [Tanacetum coccineum]|uniref:Retrovirus-related pol polyprotein from transposon TNT 1-94 n=1 Tax=Tanacetum coccineum TaxID=301880 RepID=A0ABQ4WHV4_9ASTR